MPDVKHPEIKVKLSGQDGNAFVIMGRVECVEGDYDHFLRTCMKWVTVL